MERAKRAEFCPCMHVPHPSIFPPLTHTPQEFEKQNEMFEIHLSGYNKYCLPRSLSSGTVERMLAITPNIERTARSRVHSSRCVIKRKKKADFAKQSFKVVFCTVRTNHTRGVYPGYYPTKNFCEFCIYRTFIPVPGTSGSSV